MEAASNIICRACDAESGVLAFAALENGAAKEHKDFALWQSDRFDTVGI
jgi:hypothetical protein